MISYYKTNAIITLKKDVDVEDSLLEKTFDEEVNNSVKSELERQLAKIGKMYFQVKYLNLLFPKYLIRKKMHN